MFCHSPITFDRNVDFKYKLRHLFVPSLHAKIDQMTLYIRGMLKIHRLMKVDNHRHL